MLSFLLSLSFSYMTELPKYWRWKLGSYNNPIFITFVRQSCKFSQNFIPKFEEVSQLFPHIGFVEIDCDKESSVCNKFDVVSTPTSILFKGNVTRQIEYVMPRTKNSLVNFLEMYTAQTSVNSSNYPKILFPTTINDFINSTSCTVTLFRVPDLTASDKMWKMFRQMTTSFENEDISFGSINCMTYNCIGYAQYLPEMQVRKNGTILEKFSRIPNIKNLLSAINKCGDTHRKVNGMLEDDYGVTEDIKNAINQTFIRAQRGEIEKEKTNDPIDNLINKIIREATKSNDQADYFAGVLHKIDSFIANKKTSLDSIDNLTIRRNIITCIMSLFL